MPKFRDRPDRFTGPDAATYTYDGYRKMVIDPIFFPSNGFVTFFVIPLIGGVASGTGTRRRPTTMD